MGHSGVQSLDGALILAYKIQKTEHMHAHSAVELPLVVHPLLVTSISSTSPDDGRQAAQLLPAT